MTGGDRARIRMYTLSTAISLMKSGVSKCCAAAPFTGTAGLAAAWALRGPPPKDSFIN